MIELMLTTDVSENQALKTEIDEITKETSVIRQEYQMDSDHELKQRAVLEDVNNEYIESCKLIQLALDNKNEEAYQYFETGVLLSLSNMDS